MNPSTIDQLLALNRALYREHATEFSETRQKPWRGWERLVSHLPKRVSSVLDAGCGNGRFGLFIDATSYTGIDESAPLLALARTALPDASLIESDLFSWTPSAQYELVAAMGVLHHVPTQELRRELAIKLASAAGRYLAMSFWSFDVTRAIDPTRVGIEPAELEPGDFILRFGDGGFRYCHLASGAEIVDLVYSTGMALLDRWIDDAANTYVLLVR